MINSASEQLDQKRRDKNAPGELGFLKHLAELNFTPWHRAELKEFLRQLAMAERVLPVNRNEELEVGEYQALGGAAHSALQRVVGP